MGRPLLQAQADREKIMELVKLGQVNIISESQGQKRIIGKSTERKWSAGTQ
jgi:hypothetical protein